MNSHSLIFTHDSSSIVYPRIENLDDWVYIIKPYSPPRNVDQNALLFALYTLVEKETWNDKDYLHEMMKKKYLSHKRLVKLWGKRSYVTKIKSSSKLNRKEFSEFFSKVELFFSELWYTLPPRDSLEFQNLVNSYY